MLRCSSGSSTGRRASMTSASVTGIAGLLGSGCRWCGGRVPAVGDLLRAIGRIPPWHEPRRDRAASPTATRPDRRPSSPRRSPPSPRPSATPPAARSTSSPTSTRRRASPPPRWPSASPSTPTWPATTSTSWPAAGYLEVAVARDARRAAPAARRSATGRPATEIAVEVPVRHDDVLITLLGRALDAAAAASRRRRWPRRSASSTAGPWPRSMGDAGRAASARSARPCTPWPTP